MFVSFSVWFMNDDSFNELFIYWFVWCLIHWLMFRLMNDSLIDSFDVWFMNDDSFDVWLMFDSWMMIRLMFDSLIDDSFNVWFMIVSFNKWFVSWLFRLMFDLLIDDSFDVWFISWLIRLMNDIWMMIRLIFDSWMIYFIPPLASTRSNSTPGHHKWRQVNDLLDFVHFPVIRRVAGNGRNHILTALIY